MRRIKSAVPASWLISYETRGEAAFQILWLVNRNTWSLDLVENHICNRKFDKICQHFLEAFCFIFSFIPHVSPGLCYPVGKTVLVPTVHPRETSGESLSSASCVSGSGSSEQEERRWERRLNRERKLLRLLLQPQNDWVLGLLQLLHCRAATTREYQINLADKRMHSLFFVLFNIVCV